MATRRLLREADRIERDFREVFLPRFIEESRLMGAVDFEKLSTADLVAEVKRLHDRFVFDTHVAVDVVNIAAGFYLSRARQVLSADGMDSITLNYAAENYSYYTLSLFPVTSSQYNKQAADYSMQNGMNLVKNLVQGVRLTQLTG